MAAMPTNERCISGFNNPIRGHGPLLHTEHAERQTLNALTCCGYPDCFLSAHPLI